MLTLQLNKGEYVTVNGIETNRYVSGQFQMLKLVLTYGNNVCLIQ